MKFYYNCWRCFFSGALVILIALSAGGTFAQEEDNKEYKLKAAFLYNFLQYTEWLKGEGKNGHALTLCIAGEDPFGATLAPIESKTVNGLPIKLKTNTSDGELTRCNVVFISESEKGRVEGIISKLQGLPVLTVSEVEDFTALGGMIGFVRQNGKIRFEINPTAAGRAGLKFSAKLLELALIRK